MLLMFFKPYQVFYYYSIIFIQQIFFERMKLKKSYFKNIKQKKKHKTSSKTNANDHKKGLRQGIFMMFVLICCRKRQLKA